MQSLSPPLSRQNGVDMAWTMVTTRTGQRVHAGVQASSVAHAVTSGRMHHQDNYDQHDRDCAAHPMTNLRARRRLV